MEHPAPRRPEDDLKLAVVICEPAAYPGPARNLGPTEFRAGAFYFMGDGPLIRRLKPLFGLPPEPGDLPDPRLMSDDYRSLITSDHAYTVPANEP